MATRSMPLWPRPATTSGSLWPGSGLCAPFSGRLSLSGMTRAAPPPHPPDRPSGLFHRRLADERLRLPVHRDEREQPVLDLVPLRGARRQMVHGDLDAEFVGKTLQLTLPQPHP